MTDIERRALSERIATLAEQAGLPSALLWEPRCPQGHEDVYGVDSGGFCPDCAKAWFGSSTELVGTTWLQMWQEMKHQHANLAWHPEWRIGRVAKDLTDPTSLLAVVEAWRAQKLPENKLYPRYWAIDSAKDVVEEGMACAVVVNEFNREYAWDAETPWEALAQAFAEALEKGVEA